MSHWLAADRHSHADLPGPLRNHVRQYAVYSERRKQQRQSSESPQKLQDLRAIGEFIIDDRAHGADIGNGLTAVNRPDRLLHFLSRSGSAYGSGRMTTIERAENGRVDPDSQSQNQHDGQGESRRAPQHADRVTPVGSHGLLYCPGV